MVVKYLFLYLVFTLHVAAQELLNNSPAETQTVQVHNSSTENWKPHHSQPLIYNADKEFRDETKQNDCNNTKNCPIQNQKKCAQLAKFTPNLCDNDDAKIKCEICKPPSAALPSLECGLREPTGIPPETMEKDSDIHTRIVGGKESNPGEWPWQVSIFRGSNKQFCGGAVLSRDFVLTSSHIFGEGWTYPEDWAVCSGDHWRSEPKDLNAKKHYVKKILHHKDFKESFKAHEKKKETFSSKFDIAILQLNESIELIHENKGRLCLPDNDHPIPIWSTCYITGWGDTKYKGDAPEQLQKSKIKLMTHSECNSPDFYNETIDESTLCAGFEEPGIGTCNGDSGGSLACYVEGRWYSTGVVSGGYKCGQARYAPSIFANVTYLKDWIVSTILNNSDDVT